MITAVKHIPSPAFTHAGNLLQQAALINSSDVYEAIACRVQYRITGRARETINFLNGNSPSTAVCTVRPGRKDWIVEVVSKADP